MLSSTLHMLTIVCKQQHGTFVQVTHTEVPDMHTHKQWSGFSAAGNTGNGQNRCIAAKGLREQHVST